jgi:Xaa-Pro aminopeptidase
MNDIMTRTLADQAWLKALLDAARLDAVIAASPAHVRLLSGHATWLDTGLREWMVSPRGGDVPYAGFAVADSAGRIGLVANSVCRAEAESAGADFTALFDKRADGRSAVVALDGLLGDMGLAGARLGIEQLEIHSPSLSRISPDRRPASDASLLLRLARTVKSPAALQLLAEATRATELALAHLAANWSAPPGGASVQAQTRTALAGHGVDFDHVAYGMPGGGVATTAPRVFQDGLTTFIDAGGRLAGFVSDTGVTFAHGDPPAEIRALYDRAYNAICAGAEALIPGRRPSAALARMTSLIAGTPLTAQGHGLGLGIREWPFFGMPTSEVVAEGALRVPLDHPLHEGTVVNLEIGGHLPDGCSLQIEQTWVVGPSHPSPIVPQPRENWIVTA